MIAGLTLAWLAAAAPLVADDGPGFDLPPALAVLRSDHPLVADDGPGFDLPRALAVMRSDHPLLEVAAARVDAARAGVTAARLWDNPVLAADYFVGVRASSYDRAGTFVVGVGQWLPVTATPRLRGAVAGHEAAAVALAGERLRRALELEVEAGMLRLAAALREVEVRRAALQDLGESRRIVDARVAAGVAPAYDATRMALALADAEALLRAAEAAVSVARGELAVAVGPRADELRGAPRIDVFGGPALPSLAALRDRMLVRPDLAAARARTQAARAGVRLARREVFPGLGLRVAAGFGQGPGQVDVGAGLSIPLPILSRGQGLVDRARAEARAAERAAAALVVAAEQRLAAAYLAAERRRDASQRYTELSHDAADALLRQAASGYRDGRLGVLELADASLSVRDMRLRDVELAVQARLAELDVRHAVEVGGE
ncbi:MAG: TolC family protein [Myxococcales bacterium]|nr:TolC family protein [Myxococcales bacterium]